MGDRLWISLGTYRAGVEIPHPNLLRPKGSIMVGEMWPVCSRVGSGRECLGGCAIT